MHSYQPNWPADRTNWDPPSPTMFTYRDAHDVARFASIDPLTTWYTYPHVWHLDDQGCWCCCSKGSSGEGVRRVAESPERMLYCRLEATGTPCPDYWVVLEPRHEWSAPYHVTEGDAQAFLSLRSSLADLGVTLLDVVIFNQEHQWWSLDELTSGSSTWRFAPADRQGWSDARPPWHPVPRRPGQRGVL